MRIDQSSSLFIELRNRELRTFSEILRLASERLYAVPATPLHGSPHRRQAGLVANDLIDVEVMLGSLAEALGVRIQVFHTNESRNHSLPQLESTP
ncbi:hypothetical protein [Chitiniphilus eburneus]|uniref:Uncharacterized protein n=1 Tax=Chitiniphilus eburneus TaxID=2571148 RepID=A0A4U0PYW8_9NEIS|nr:hypothetical protein [Chitiniphilus eburneus]TJZ73769.1 hypothetical protein FAZ21_09095 [Chitiniphilus eburneus]